VLTVLAAACRDHLGLRFDYEDRRGSASQRRVEPHRAVHAEGRWYLVAWDIDRGDWRTFRVDRIRSEITTGHRTAPRDLSDDEITALISRGVPAAARRYRTRVTVLAPAEAIAERVGPWVGTVEPIDAFSCILETGADDLDILAVHLGMLDVDFIVTEPPELVTHMQALGERYSRAVRA
jgi:predicted DNA-binding transcriptional regulator YafY